MWAPSDRGNDSSIMAANYAHFFRVARDIGLVRHKHCKWQQHGDMNASGPDLLTLSNICKYSGDTNKASSDTS